MWSIKGIAGYYLSNTKSYKVQHLFVATYITILYSRAAEQGGLGGL